jgi:hypothetical protein
VPRRTKSAFVLPPPCGDEAKAVPSATYYQSIRDTKVPCRLKARRGYPGPATPAFSSRRCVRPCTEARPRRCLTPRPFLHIEGQLGYPPDISFPPGGPAAHAMVDPYWTWCSPICRARSPPYPAAATLSCVLVSKSLASCRSRSWLAGSPKMRFTIRPRFTAGRAATASAQRWRF